jgi:hypothetical protein
MRQVLRTDKHEPPRQKFKIEHFWHEPRCTKPITDMLEPSLTLDRTDIVEPKRVVSNTDALCATRQKLRNEHVDPRLVQAMTDNF